MNNIQCRDVDTVVLKAGATGYWGDLVFMQTDDQKVDPMAAAGTLVLGIAQAPASTTGLPPTTQSATFADGDYIQVKLLKPLRQWRIPGASATYQDLNLARTAAGVLLSADSGTDSTLAQREALIGQCFPVYGASGGYGVNLDGAAANTTCPFKLWEFEEDSYTGRLYGWYSEVKWWTGASVGNQAELNVA